MAVKLFPEYRGQGDALNLLYGLVEECTVIKHPDREKNKQGLLTVLGNTFQGESFGSLSSSQLTELKEKIRLCLDYPEDQQDLLNYINSLL